MIIKPGSELTENEISQIKEAILREFNVPFNISDQAEDRFFFLLKNEDTIIAMGALWEVKPVVFNEEAFAIYGVLNVVANTKGKGFGKEVVTAMKDYLIKNNLTGIGFCMPKNAGFYKKCGFMISCRFLIFTSNFQHFFRYVNSRNIFEIF